MTGAAPPRLFPSSFELQTRMRHSRVINDKIAIGRCRPHTSREKTEDNKDTNHGIITGLSIRDQGATISLLYLLQL
eukprot:scaffold5059_cov185-Chaetoceros_neogracile.AAC.2